MLKSLKKVGCSKKSRKVGVVKRVKSVKNMNKKMRKIQKGGENSDVTVTFGEHSGLGSVLVTNNNMRNVLSDKIHEFENKKGSGYTAEQVADFFKDSFANNKVIIQQKIKMNDELIATWNKEIAKIKARQRVFIDVMKSLDANQRQRFINELEPKISEYEGRIRNIERENDMHLKQISTLDKISGMVKDFAYHI